MGTTLKIIRGSIDALVDGLDGQAYHLNGLRSQDGGNSIAIARDPSLFGQEELSIGIAFKADTVGDGGSLFRIHQALQIDITDDGQVVFRLIANSVGESGVIATTGRAVTDGAWHHVALSYDAQAGTMTGYVDGSAVGHIAVTGPTKLAEYWDPMIGDPWGTGFAGLVDNVEIRGQALSAEDVGRQYAALAPDPEPSAPELFKLDFETGELADRSGNGLVVTQGSATSVADGAYYLNGLLAKDGGNSLAVERDASLFAKDQLSMSFDLKSAEPGVGGILFRIHTALKIEVAKTGQVVFNLMENSVGESGVIKTSGVNVADGLWHRVSLTYDATGGTMIGYVDGAAAGEIRVSGPTMTAEYWDPMIGSPWGAGFRGFVDNIVFHDGIVPPPIDAAPVARPDYAVTAEDTPLTLSESALLANDRAPYGDSLSITDVRVVSGHGSADVTANGDVVYRPAPDQNGDAVLEYRVDDGNGGRTTSTVHVGVTAVNDAPTVADATFSVLATAAQGTVVGSVRADDPEGEAMSFAITGGNNGGIFGIDAAGRIVINAPDLLAARPETVHTLSVTATDAGGASTTGETQIEVNSLTSLFAAAQAGYERPILVNDSASFISALQNATGGETILLRPDVDYGGVVKSANPGATVAVTSLDPMHPATIIGLDLRSANHVTFENLHFEFRGTPAMYQTDVIVTNSHDIRFTDSTFTGVADGYGAVGEPTAQSLMRVSDSSGFTFDNNDVSRYLHGVYATRTQGISIHDNEIHHMQGDGMRFAQVQGIDIETNYLHDFFGSDSAVTHVDYVQFWTTNTVAPSTGITIAGNVFMSGEFQSQAIFFRDERGDAGLGEMRYQDVRIEENVIYNADHHSITVSNADGLAIHGNSVISHPLGGAVPSINVANSTGVEVYDNVTPQLSVAADNDVLRLEDNVVVQDQYATQANHIDDLFVNPRQGTDAHVDDLYVMPGSALARGDGTVVGSEQLRVPTDPDGLNAVAVGTAIESQDGTAYAFDARLTANETGLVAENDARFVWDFGDGGTAEGQRVDHAYDLPGEYQVILSVLHDDGTVDDAQFRAVVDAPLDVVLNFDDGSLAFHDSDPNA